MNSGEQESKKTTTTKPTHNQKTKQKQFAVHDSDTSVTLNQSQIHKIWYELVDPKQCHNNAKFEKLRLNSVRVKANDKLFAKSENTSVIFS